MNLEKPAKGFRLNPEWGKATHFFGVPQFDGTIREGMIIHPHAFDELKIGPEPVKIQHRKKKP